MVNPADKEQRARDLLRRRLREALDADPTKTQAGLAEAAGVTEQAVSKWLRTGKVGRSRLPEIAAYLNRDIGYFLTEEKKRELRKNVEPGPNVRGFVPLISWVTAGAWTAVEDPYQVGDAEQWVPCPVSHGHRTFVLRVRGESMEPEYRDGDWIFVDPDRAPVNGSHVVVRLEDEHEATFKKLVLEGDSRYLVALNPAWPERVIRINRNATIIGTVIFSGKPRV